MGSIATGGAGQVALLVSGVLSARLLGVEDRGHLALLGLFPVVLAQVGALGLPVAATYFIARDRSQADAVVRALLRIAVIQLGILLPLHIGILIAVLGGSSRNVLIAAGISVFALPAIFSQQYGLAILQGRGRFRAFNTLRLLPSVLYATGVVTVAALGAGHLPTITAIWAASFIFPAVLTVAYARQSLTGQVGGDPPETKALLAFGLRGLLGSASPLETFRLDQAVVGLFLSPAALGLYAAGVAFTSLPRFIAQSIGMVAYPTVAGRDRANARRTMWRFCSVAVALSAGVVVTIELAAGWLVPNLFGSDFAEGVPVARILLLGALFLSVRRVLSDGARGAGEPTVATIAEVVSWICLVPLLAVLTPLFGLTGVAWSLTLSSAISLGSMLVILTRRGLGLRSPSRGGHDHVDLPSSEP